MTLDLLKAGFFFPCSPFFPGTPSTAINQSATLGMASPIDVTDLSRGSRATRKSSILLTGRMTNLPSQGIQYGWLGLQVVSFTRRFWT